MQRDKTFLAEMLLGGSSSVVSGIFTNPLDCLQLHLSGPARLKQDFNFKESSRRKASRFLFSNLYFANRLSVAFLIETPTGSYQVIYRNIFHAAYLIAKTESIFALQKGLVPALWYQFVMNGFRFGTFSTLENNGMLKNKNGETSFVKLMAASALSGSIGSGIGSPFFMVKTQLQTNAAKSIAVGHQHGHDRMMAAFKKIYRKHGVIGIYASAFPAMLRTTIGSCVQLTSFSQSRVLYDKYGLIAHNSWHSNLVSALSGGVCVVLFMTPFDLSLSRLYNQPVDPNTGKGKLYRGLLDTLYKTVKIEGFLGLYKGFSAAMLRQLPHSLINLFFWQQFRKVYYEGSF